MEENIISYKGVDIKENGKYILEDINFELNKGQIAYITGEVGSGKSTFLKTLYGEKKISAGKAVVNGFDLQKITSKKLPQLRKSIGLVLQKQILLNDRNVEKNIRFAAECIGEKDKKKISNRIEELTEKTGLEKILYKMPYELSGGEQQLVCVIRAVINKPQLLILDEPTINLDENNSQKIIEFMKDLNQQGTSLVIATHDQYLTSQYVAKIHNIENKKLI